MKLPFNNPLAKEKYVWAVRCSNYDPMEIDSIWDTREGARKRVSELPNGMWNVCAISVQSA